MASMDLGGVGFWFRSALGWSHLLKTREHWVHEGTDREKSLYRRNERGGELSSVGLRHCAD